jgi:hypothetical protein
VIVEQSSSPVIATVRSTMRHLLLSGLLASVVLGASTAAQTSRQEIQAVAAFARLYGVARYFYPSDAAAGLDWNRFAIHGVKEVRAARDAKALDAALEALFQPLGRGIVIADRLPPAPAPGGPDPQLIAWRYLGAGLPGGLVSGPYKGKRTNRSLVSNPSIDGFANLMQTVPAVNLRGKTIRLRGLVRATVGDSTGGAALWLRVDRADKQMGFFDNMGSRPVREPKWREYAIEGPVAEDATSVAFGVMASGAVTADFESIGLAVRGADGAWTDVTIDDSGFEAAPASESAVGANGWMRSGTSKTVAITRPSGEAPEGRQFLRFSPPASAISNAELFESAPVAGAHVDVDLGSELKARVLLALTDAEAAQSSSALPSLQASLGKVALSTGDAPPDLDTRLADVVVAWNVFRHFYPYWTEAGVDWDARLPSQLALVYDATTRDAHRTALRQLVADVRDGHGSVNDPRGSRPQGRLPLQLGTIEGRLVITASAVPAEAPVGAVVSSVNGTPADRRLDETMRLVSGTTQWKRTRALQEISTCTTGTPVALVIDRGTGPQSLDVRCEAGAPPLEKRPDPVTELATGVWYVDLTRAPMAQITPVLAKLTSATGVVFDVRGYPTDAGFQILPHLTNESESDRWMHVNKIVGPFGQSAGWESFGWNLKPVVPRVGGKVVFMTDGRAISYAESVMGYVADRKLGTIVGSPTAGANGNVAAFTVPGGFTISFTGMRVTGHDGQTPHHLAGVKPDIPVAPTIAGLRAGRDEVLDRAVAVIGSK